MQQFTQNIWRLSALSLGILALTACGDDEKIVEVPVEVIVEVPPPPPPPPVDYVYQVTVTNLTAAQPLSPVGLVVHDGGHLWSVGEAASVALERLAEGGDNSMLIENAGLASISGAGIIAPGDSETIEITVQDNDMAQLSFATMLVNTNDAFAGLDAWDLGNLAAAGDMWTTTLPVLDAGTEFNSEQAGSIPGPADGGEGYNPMRIGSSVVTLHGGVVSADDGLSSSVLSVNHKFDNPALRVTVMRVQ